MRSILLSIIFVQVGCATIVKSEHQTVRFIRNSHQGQVKIVLPDGTLKMNEMTHSFQMSRSREPIPMEITCNGKTTNGLIPVHFDLLTGGAGNLALFLVTPPIVPLVGGVIDAMGEKAYDIKSPFNIEAYCHQ